MVNINGTLIESKDAKISVYNRGYNYGDALFETIKVVHGKILFLEDHYFRLMASMRILRMEIHNNFTLEFIQDEILKTIKGNELFKKSARVKLIVNRREGGFYTPDNHNVDFIITIKNLDQDFYLFNAEEYRVDLYKDFYVTPGLLSTIKTNNKLINITGSVYAKENDFANCLLLNTNKNVIEALNSNLFLVKANIIKTPPLADGCLKGIMRTQIIDIISKLPDYQLEEVSISPFELQKADELFITNVVNGIQPITHYRKKTYSNKVSRDLIGKLNARVRLS